MKLSTQFFRFLCVGGVAFFIQVFTTYVFTDLFGFWYFWSYLVGVLSSWTFIFFANSLLTFPGNHRGIHTRRYSLFLGTYSIAFIINAGLVYSLTSLFNVYYLLSITTATIITVLITFSLSKGLIFKYEDIP